VKNYLTIKQVGYIKQARKTKKTNLKKWAEKDSELEETTEIKI
jgi:hypothetical protein